MTEDNDSSNIRGASPVCFSREIQDEDEDEEENANDFVVHQTRNILALRNVGPV
ncbi:hypothetical protein BGZ81_003952, partial [Podila clonocystis]